MAKKRTSKKRTTKKRTKKRTTKKRSKRVKGRHEADTDVVPDFKKFVYFIQGRSLRRAGRGRGNKGHKQTMAESVLDKREKGRMYWLRKKGKTLEVRSSKLKNSK